MQERGVHKIQNHCHVIFSYAAQMSVIVTTVLEFGRIALNFISYFFGSINKTALNHQ
jgi:hypothetical protein